MFLGRIMRDFMIILSSPLVQTFLSHRLFSIWHRWDLAKPSNGAESSSNQDSNSTPQKLHRVLSNLPKKNLFSMLRIQIDSVASSVPLLNQSWELDQKSFEKTTSSRVSQLDTSRWYVDVDVSENSGTPKSSILIRFSIINHPFWGTPIFGNTHVC